MEDGISMAWISTRITNDVGVMANYEFFDANTSAASDLLTLKAHSR